MFKDILLPIDLSEKHDPALKIAMDLARQGGGDLTLLHVIEVIAGVSLEEEKDFYQRLEKTANQHLARLGDLLSQAGISWRAVTLFGNRGPEIVKFAREAKSDLIVLTSPRIDPSNPAAGWGSLSYKVSFFSSCPVLLVR